MQMVGSPVDALLTLVSKHVACQSVSGGFSPLQVQRPITSRGLKGMHVCEGALVRQPKGWDRVLLAATVFRLSAVL